MKKLLVSFFVIMSTGYAFADAGWGGGGGNSLPTTSSTVGVRQTINGITGSGVANDASVGQLALGLGGTNVSAQTNVSQAICDVTNSLAINSAEVSNVAVGIAP